MSKLLCECPFPFCHAISLPFLLNILCFYISSAFLLQPTVTWNSLQKVVSSPYFLSLLIFLILVNSIYLFLSWVCSLGFTPSPEVLSSAQYLSLCRNQSDLQSKQPSLSHQFTRLLYNCASFAQNSTQRHKVFWHFLLQLRKIKGAKT